MSDNTWPSEGEVDYMLPDGSFKHIRYRDGKPDVEWIDNSFLGVADSFVDGLIEELREKTRPHD